MNVVFRRTSTRQLIQRGQSVLSYGRLPYSKVSSSRPLFFSTKKAIFKNFDTSLESLFDDVESGRPATFIKRTLTQISS